jgi:hypothetical protein
MPDQDLAALLAVWQLFQPYLTRPAFARMLPIAAGWILTTAAKRAITETLVVTGIAGKRHHEAYHRFFSRGTWSPDHIGLELLWHLHKRGMPLMLVLDDTVAPKKGPSVHGIGSHVDPVRSTKAFRVFTFGHCWVVLCMVIHVPFSQRPWALPVLFRLYRNKKECAAKGAAYHKKTELGRELIGLVASRFPNERIEMAADSAYTNSTLLVGKPVNVVFFGAMRPDAVLTDLPKPRARSAKGRPVKRGAPLPKPEQLASDESVPWQTCEANLYQTARTVEFKTVVAQWYRGADVSPLRIVIVKCWTGNIPWRVYMCTDLGISVPLLLETYARRWSIEVAFRELKQTFGFGDSCARSENAVLRTAPFVGLLYSTLIIWFLGQAHLSPIAAPPVRPWYPHKRDLCFNDILRAARRVLGTSDILVPSCDFDNLREYSASPSVPCRSHDRIAA